MDTIASSGIGTSVALPALGAMREDTALSLTRSHALDLDMPMDTGIAPYVHLLRCAGIETYESCEGGEGHVFPEPTIRFHGGRAAGFKALSVAIEHGLPIYGIRRLWTVDDGELTGPVWEIVFRKKARPEE